MYIVQSPLLGLTLKAPLLKSTFSRGIPFLLFFQIIFASRGLGWLGNRFTNEIKKMIKRQQIFHFKIANTIVYI